MSLSASHITREAEEAGCYGLVDGYARNINTYELFSAESCMSSDGPFFCPTCLSGAIVRKCTEKKDHFAHDARKSPVPRPESDLHRICKTEICNTLAEVHPNGKWQVERTIQENKAKGTPELRPDISGYIDDNLVAVEVQVSALTLPKIIDKTIAYTKWNINVLWIIPLTRELGELPFRPRLYERYLHSMYFGRVYYWQLGQGADVDAVHFGIAGRELEYREWHEDGELKSAGGYFKAYKTIKTPMSGGQINIGSHFISRFRDEFKPNNIRKNVPKCLLWQDRLPTWWNEVNEDKFSDAYFEEIGSDLKLPRKAFQHEQLTTKCQKSHHFRTVLENKWGIFFDAMQIKYEYEKQTFHFDDGSSLTPSFWLPQVGMWGMVRLNKFTGSEIIECHNLADFTGKGCLLLEGPPDFRSYWGISPYEDDDRYCDTDYLLTSEYIHSENRFFCGTGYTRENPATDKDFFFGNDYVSAVNEAKQLI